MNRLIKFGRGPLLPLSLIVACGLVWAGLHSAGQVSPTSTVAPVLRNISTGLDEDQTRADVLFLEALERVPSSTAADWVGVADAVVTINVTAEKRVPPPKSETTGQGRDLIGRTVTAKIGEILWMASEATRKPPEELQLNVMGWLTDATGSRETPVSLHGTSRLEVDHTYVVALVWMRSECSGDEQNAAGWASIGSGGILPADDGIIGQGEYEGSIISVEQSKRLNLAEGSVLADHLGAKPNDITKALGQTRTSRVDFQADSDSRC